MSPPKISDVPRKKKGRPSCGRVTPVPDNGKGHEGTKTRWAVCSPNEGNSDFKLRLSEARGPGKKKTMGEVLPHRMCPTPATLGLGYFWQLPDAEWLWRWEAGGLLFHFTAPGKKKRAGNNSAGGERNTKKTPVVTGKKETIGKKAGVRHQTPIDMKKKKTQTKQRDRKILCEFTMETYNGTRCEAKNSRLHGWSSKTASSASSEKHGFFGKGRSSRGAIGKKVRRGAPQSHTT